MRFGFCAGVAHLATLTAAGYDYIEPAVAGTVTPETAAPEVMPALRESFQAETLVPEAWNVFLPGDLKVVGPDVDADRQLQYLRSAFSRVAALGGKIVVFGSGRSRQVPDGFPADEVRRQIVGFLRLAAPEAAARGVTVAIEPLNTGECNVINSVAEGMSFVAEVNHPAIQVLSDLYHVSQDGQSFEETRAAGTHLAHVHVAGAENRRVPNAADVDYLAAFFGVLREMGYAGRISVEGGATDLPRQAAEAVGVLHRAWELA